jgi:enamine deaminase RidA (YjgF/YER057c/UK114 family)
VCGTLDTPEFRQSTKAGGMRDRSSCPQCGPDIWGRAVRRPQLGLATVSTSGGIQRISSRSPFEPIAGYCRAVVAGPYVEVAGTTAPQAGDTPYAQAKGALEVIGTALAEAGVTFADVVRTRIFVTDISQWEAVARAHAEVFGAIRPVTTMVEVSALIDPQMLVEIEATAYRGAQP